jgi:hypothetical protein
MNNRNEYDFTDLVDFEYLDSDPSVHAGLYGLSHFDGQPLVVLAEPLDAHQHFVPQASHDSENGISYWYRSHHARGDCSALQLSTSFNADIGKDTQDQARTTGFPRVQKEVSQEQVGFFIRQHQITG